MSDIIQDGGNVTINAPTAHAFERAPAEFVQHRCPLCALTFDWPAFQQHAPACIAAHPERVASIRARG